MLVTPPPLLLRLISFRISHLPHRRDPAVDNVLLQVVAGPAAWVKVGVVDVRAGEEDILRNVHVSHDLLRPVPVVNVEVNNGHLLHPPHTLEGVEGPDSHGVEDAEAAARAARDVALPTGVVPGGADDDEGVLVLAGAHLVDGMDDTPRCPEGGVQASN